MENTDFSVEYAMRKLQGNCLQCGLPKNNYHKSCNEKSIKRAIDAYKEVSKIIEHQETSDEDRSFFLMLQKEMADIRQNGAVKKNE